MQKVLITGGAGFLGSYLCEEFLSRGYRVTCVDNFSKYGDLTKPFFNHHCFTLVRGDCKDISLMRDLMADVDLVVAGAAMIGGISYFHKYAYDLLAENERILASTFDAAIDAHRNAQLKRIVVISSSMVFESTLEYPTSEATILLNPPPVSTYGFQKLSSEYFAKGAFEQYRLPYTIVRPFNAVGIGEARAQTAEKITRGSITLALSHVLPDLAQKMVKGQRPLEILGNGSQVRCYTHGKDIARGIFLASTSEKSLNEDFNISTSRATTVLELANLVWDFFEPNSEFEYRFVEPYTYDVQRRIPSVKKAQRILGFQSEIDLEQSVVEVCEWVEQAVRTGVI